MRRAAQFGGAFSATAASTGSESVISTTIGSASLHVRAFSSVAAASATTVSTASTNSVAGYGDEAPGLCYILGEHGKVPFDRLFFVPLKEAMRKTPSFDHVPEDRLIDTVDSFSPTFTSQFGKNWIRSGYLTPFFAKKLGCTVKGAFVDRNVGIISGLNVIAFLTLDISSTTSPASSNSSSSTPDKYPMSYSGFTDFIQDHISEVYGTSLTLLPQGMQELMNSTRIPTMPDYVIVYHPEFLSLEGVASLYLQGWRVLRREMPALGEFMQPYTAILRLDRMVGPHYFMTCLNNDMVRSWLGVHTPKPSTVPGLLGLPAGSSMNSMALTKSEWAQLKALLKLLYASGGLQASHASSGTYTTPSGPKIPKNPKEAAILDVHRHCIAQTIEAASVAARKRLEAKLNTDHAQSFKNKPMEWQDGVQLMLHKFPRFPHCVVVVFQKAKIWNKLNMESKLPIPRVYYLPSFGEK